LFLRDTQGDRKKVSRQLNITCLGNMRQILEVEEPQGTKKAASKCVPPWRRTQEQHGISIEFLMLSI
jgi:hypothetical protein